MWGMDRCTVKLFYQLKELFRLRWSFSFNKESPWSPRAPHRVGLQRTTRSEYEWQWRYMNIREFQITGNSTVISTAHLGQQQISTDTKALHYQFLRKEPTRNRCFTSQKPTNAESASLPWSLHLHGQSPLQWHHNGRDSVSNHQPHDCLLNNFLRNRSKNISKLRVTGLCAGNSPVTGEFPAQRASNAENVSIWWRRHD